MSGSVASPVPIEAIAPETTSLEGTRSQIASSVSVAETFHCACQRPKEPSPPGAPAAGIATSKARVTVSPAAVEIAAAT